MHQGTGLRSFADRNSAGIELAAELRGYYWRDPVVSGLARGGVLVAAALASELSAPLEVSVVRKIGAPGHPEFGIGATTATQEPTYDQASLDHLGLTRDDLASASAEHQAEAQRMLALYETSHTPAPRDGRDVIVVDDGLATGISATAVLRAERAMGPRTLTLAVPVGSAGAAAGLRTEADRVICLIEPDHFRAVGLWYEHFGQVGDDEVVEALQAAHRRSDG